MTDTTLAPGLSNTRKWLGFAALCAGMFMAVLDVQIVVTSLNVIEDALRIGADRMSWIQTSYLIAEVIVIPLTGVLTRILSLRLLVACGISLFTLASVGCAFSTDFESLIFFRVLQGAGAGVLIPVVFTAIFLFFRQGREQSIATTLGGVLVVMAPAFGPMTGGYITEHLSWHWLFLINVVPGLLTMAVALACLPRERPQWASFRRIDLLSLLFLAISLAALEIGLKESPNRGWLSPVTLSLFASFAVAMLLSGRRSSSIISFPLLADRNLGFGCAISFILGIGLFGSVYLLPVFLALVQHMGPIEIGGIILVTGLAQLVSAPISVWLDDRFGARVLTAIGFGIFALGLLMSSWSVRTATPEELFWPQIVRGAAIGLCIIPVTRFALGLLPHERVSDASGLYNLSRNLGGAIGIALIDTVLFTRSAEHAAVLTDLLAADPAAAALALAISPDELPDPGDPLGLMGIMDPLQEAALTLAVNEAWMMLAALTGVAVILVGGLRPIRLPASYVPQRKGRHF